MGSYVSNNLICVEQVVYTNNYNIFCNLKSLLTLFIFSFLTRYPEEYAVTIIRIIIMTGLIGRRFLELNLTKVESVMVNQTVFGRIPGFRDVVIIGTGGTGEIFTDFSKPNVFRKKFIKN
jgi:uncharacterized membrane protein YdbT with pleckstrin-like domain